MEAIAAIYGLDPSPAKRRLELSFDERALLDTLPLREMRAGYAEVAKYGLIDDARFFAWCEANWQGIFAGGPERDEAVAQSCRAKADVVVRDEHETGDRFSTFLGLAPAVDAERVEAHLKAAGLPTRLGDVPGGCGTVDHLLDAMAQDKKVKGGALTFILARGIGQSFIAPGIDPDRVRAFLANEIDASQP